MRRGHGTSTQIDIGKHGIVRGLPPFVSVPGVMRVWYGYWLKKINIWGLGCAATGVRPRSVARFWQQWTSDYQAQVLHILSEIKLMRKQIVAEWDRWERQEQTRMEMEQLRIEQGRSLKRREKIQNLADWLGVTQVRFDREWVQQIWAVQDRFLVEQSRQLEADDPRVIKMLNEIRGEIRLHLDTLTSQSSHLTDCYILGGELYAAEWSRP